MSESGARSRHAKLRELMDRQGLGAIVLGRFPNFAWYTGGADNRVDHSSAFGVAEAVITPDRDYIVTNNIEAPRMEHEQTPNIEVISYPWYEGPASILQDLSDGKPVGGDGVPGTRDDLSSQVAALRRVLDGEQISQYRDVGALAVAAMDEAAISLKPQMTELEAAANLEAAARRRGLYCPVAMAAGDGRIVRYRHPIVHETAFRYRVMLVLCAERYGLYANLTRFVHFEEPDPELQQRFQACRTILERMREEATRPGRTLGDAFADCTRFYAEAGYPDEWEHHHQGGLTGYATREIVATPQSAESIQTGQAFAWNPSITGAKEEETFVLTQLGADVLTAELASD